MASVGMFWGAICWGVQIKGLPTFFIKDRFLHQVFTSSHLGRPQTHAMPLAKWGNFDVTWFTITSYLQTPSYCTELQFSKIVKY